jgi:hypothetical protein
MTTYKYYILFVILLFLLGYYFPNNDDHHQSILLDEVTRNKTLGVDDLFVFFLGNNEHRINITLNNLNIPSNCLVLTHSPYDVILDNKIKERGCSITWLFKYNLAQKMKHLDPFLLKPFQTITIVLDDVDIRGMMWSDYFKLVKKYELDIATPAVIDSWLPFMRPNKTTCKEDEVRMLNDVELQAVTFTKNAWTVWWSLDDLQYPHGILDLWIAGYHPNLKMGVLDSFEVIHNIQLPTTHQPSLTNKVGTIFNNQIEAWKNERNIELKVAIPTWQCVKKNLY